MRKLLLVYLFIFTSLALYAKGPRYRVMGIDSTEKQYVISLQNVSNYQIYTIYTNKIDSEDSESCIKKGQNKILTLNSRKQEKERRELASGPPHDGPMTTAPFGLWWVMTMAPVRVTLTPVG